MEMSEVLGNEESEERECTEKKTGMSTSGTCSKEKIRAHEWLSFLDQQTR